MLQVTNNEEKLSLRENELKQIQEKFEKIKLDQQDLALKHNELLEEKLALAQQLQAESEMCAEAEEVFDSYHDFAKLYHYVLWITCKLIYSQEIG